MKRLFSGIGAALAGALLVSPAAGLEMQPVPQLPPLPRRARRLPNPPRANLSRRHPDYGLTPAAHAARKQTRELNK